MRKLSADECPLYLRLCAGPSEKVLSLVLKENNTGDVNVSFHFSLRMLSDDTPLIYAEKCWYIALLLIRNVCSPQWDAFSFPELCNFLRILKREEEEHVRQIVKRYALARDVMKQAMAKINAPGWLWGIRLSLVFNEEITFCHSEEHYQQCKREGKSSDNEMLFMKQCYV